MMTAECHLLLRRAFSHSILFMRRCRTNVLRCKLCMCQFACKAILNTNPNILRLTANKLDDKFCFSCVVIYVFVIFSSFNSFLSIDFFLWIRIIFASYCQYHYYNVPFEMKAFYLPRSLLVIAARQTGNLSTTR